VYSKRIIYRSFLVHEIDHIKEIILKNIMLLVISLVIIFFPLLFQLNIISFPFPFFYSLYIYNP